MDLKNSILKSFAREVVAYDKAPQGEQTSYGTTVKYEDDIYVRLDGSDQLTPIETTTEIKEGQRVLVTIKNHSAIVTGNISSPSASTGTVQEIGDQISEFEIVIADKVDTIEFNAQVGRIDDLYSKNVTITGELDAAKADIDELQAENVTITGNLEAANAEIDNLKATKIDAEVVEANYATIANLEATNADIHNLQADYGEFKDLTTDKFTASDAAISNLQTNKLDAESAKILFATIDFANIGSAAIENFFSKSGMIGDLVVGDGTITGTLVGVTIKGDLIEGGTVVADKLVIKGTDGLYYKLNTDGETTSAEQTEYNSLNGSVITAKSITAEKISVNDLVAFGATIGGFHITEDSLYSGVKASATNTTRGVYMDDDGQFSVGDQNNFLRFFKDTDGLYKLEIQASKIKFGTGGKDLDTVAADAIVSQVAQFYSSTSPTTLSGGSWSNTQPTWQNGRYIWQRLYITHGDGSTDYSPSANGVCITGNNGPKGDQGEPGSDGAPGQDGQDGAPGRDGKDGKGISSSTVGYQLSSNGTNHPTGTWQPSPQIQTDALPYLWVKNTLNYTDGTSSTFYSVSAKGTKGLQGDPGSDGAPGAKGADGKTSYLHIAYANNSTGTSGFSTTDATNKLYIGQYTDFVQADSTDPSKYAWTLIKGSDGNGIKSSAVTYQASSSGTTIPTGIWSKSIPNVAAGQYLWTRTVFTYTDGTDSISYSVGRMGQNGSNGSPGADGSDGRGIASYAITYQASNSQTTAPTGTWSSSVPKLSTELPYLWTRTVFTYTDGSSSTSYSVSSTLDAFEVGGRNLLLSSTRFSATSPPSGLISGSVNDEGHLVITAESGNGNWYPFYENTNRSNENIAANISKGDFVTFSLSIRSEDGTVPPTVYFADGMGYYDMEGTVSTDWSTIWCTKKWILNESTMSFHLGFRSAIGTYEIRNMKLEKGNKATDWTPAPEDVDSNIQDAKDAANNAQNDVNALGPRVDKAEVSIETLADGIANLVVGSDGSTLMTQTEDGWRFNFGAFQENLENALTSIDAVEGDVSEAQAAINSAQGVIDGLVEKTSYINMGQDSSGAPYIELGKYDNDFKLRITNTSVDFMDGTTRVAYVSNQALYIERAVIKNELKIGDGAGFVWRTRSNGNMGLRWEAN